MSRDARKTERKRLKRKQKQREARKLGSLTPLQRVARDGGTLECYVNENWRENGMANVLVLGHAPGGRLAYAAFLVDFWCVGLKDAYGHREVTRGEFDDILDRMAATMEIVRIDAPTARRLVAGGIRFARQNGFRLPNHYDRWTAIFGDLGDVSAADLRGFGIDGGKIRYVGTVEFLRNRLIGCTVEQFLARPDVEWVMADGAPRRYDPAFDDAGDPNAVRGDDFDEDDGDAGLTPEQRDIVDSLTDHVRGAADRIEPALLKWCADTGRAPHPRVRDGLNILLMSMMPVAMYAEMARENPADVAGVEAPHPDDLTDDALERLSPAERPQVEAALDQVTDFMGSFKNPLAMLASLDAANGPAQSPPPAS